MCSSDLLDFSKLITHKFNGFENVEKALMLMKDKLADLIKPVVGMDYATGRTDYGWTPGRPCSWVDAYHHINFDKVRSNSTYQQEFNSWLTDSSIPSVSLLTEFNEGVVGGRNAAPRH